MGDKLHEIKIRYFASSYDIIKLASKLVRWFFSGYSDFRALLNNDRLDISAMFMKGP